MSTLSDGTRLAGLKTVGDWKLLRDKLTRDNDPNLWRLAFEQYFLERLQSRYFSPIETLQKNRLLAGEGFSIVTIQCTLIELLAATVLGKSYRNRGPIGPHEYNRSGELFKSFLSTHQPFSTDFDEDTAEAFYVNVRCAVLHEACTKGGWLIKAKSPKSRIVDAAAKIVFRDDMQVAMRDFATWYGRALLTDRLLQEAFIRKFDSLCT